MMWRVFFYFRQQIRLELEENTHVQRQVRAQHITVRQKLVKAHILGTTTLLLAQLVPVVINNLHSEGLCLLLQVAANATHS